MSSTTFNFLDNFWRIIDENGRMTWTMSQYEISILYYFNDENTDLQKIIDLLNSLGDGYSLAQRGWKLPFKMQFSDPELWNCDYFKRIEFIVKC